jgi:parallel beta-helix repeat protein
MNARVAKIIVLVALFGGASVALFGGASQVRRADASEQYITIKANGTVDPPEASVETSDNLTYTFTRDISGGIIVEKDNITVDGNGYTLQGAGTGVGIHLNTRDYVTVKSVVITGFERGIKLNTSYGNELYGNNVTKNKIGISLSSSDHNGVSASNISKNEEGIRLDHSSNNHIYKNSITQNNETGLGLYTHAEKNTIYANNISDNNNGIRFSESIDNELDGNEITNNTRGIWLDESSKNKFNFNNFIENDRQVFINMPSDTNSWDSGYPSGGNYWSDYTDADLYKGEYRNGTGSDGIWDNPYVIDENNKDYYPLVSKFLRTGSVYIRSDGTIYPPAAPIYSGDGMTYSLTSLLNYPIVVERDDIIINGGGNTLQGAGSEAGVTLSGRSNVTIKNMTIKAFYYGILFEGSSRNTISGNNVIDNTFAGIQLGTSDNNTITNNTVSSNRYGIRAINSSNCTVCWNDITNSDSAGIFLNSLSSTPNNSTLLENLIANNSVGLWIWDSSDNTVCRNSFLSNTIQVSLHDSPDNRWDGGLEGNYWSDYNGADANGDGIGDIPYVIDETNQDKLPLVKPARELPLWLEWWFWVFCTACALTGAVAVLSRASLRQKETSYYDEATARIDEDKPIDDRKIDEFNREHGTAIRESKNARDTIGLIGAKKRKKS